LVMRVQPDEKIVAGKTDGPVLLTVTPEVRLFPGKPPIIPNFSKMFATVVESKQAGRLRGRASYRMIIDSILTKDGCEYTIDAKLIEPGPFKINDCVVEGHGHTKRHILALLLPPTTIYELIRLPARGPKLVLDRETTIAIRLLQPVQLLVAMAPPRNSLSTSDLAANGTPQE